MRDIKLTGSRDIRFRAWDTVTNKMIYDANSDIKVYLNGSISMKGSWVDPEIFVLQYTGRKTPNGTDIYEGDLFGEMGGNKERPDEYEVFGEVYYDIDFASFNVRYPNGGWSTLGEHLMGTKNHREVIGNVYENFELLEVK